MHFLPWAVALTAGAAAGVCVCAALVARRRATAVLVVVAAAFMLVDLLACRAILAGTGRLDEVAAAIALSIAACGGGYALGAAILGSFGAPRPPHRPIHVAPAVPGTHIVLLSDEEPEDYEPGLVRAGLARYDDSDIDLPPEFARPLIYASERSRYQRMGGSPARACVRAVADSLQERLRARGLADDVVAAFCIGELSLHSAIQQIVADGGRRIIIVPLSAAWSRAFTVARDALPLAELEAGGVTIVSAHPLWASTDLSTMLAARVLTSLGDDRADDGVVLVSEGDPWEHARPHAEYREQLTFLIQRVRAELIRSGVAADRIRRAWLWFETPDVTEAVHHLAAVGARNVVLLPVTFPAQTISTMVDLSHAAEHAIADTGAAVTIIAPWGDDPAVIDALTETVREALEERAVR